ncbi:unnamed protein product [Umbelopsis vinacea]
MSLEIEPSQQLNFRGPLTRQVEVQLTICNPTSQLFAYKIKTTAPKQYCVKPNAGRIGANSSVPIQVILQPLKEEPAAEFKCKDKFLIQSIALTPETENVSLADLWTSLENGPKDKIHQKKIRCAFLTETEEQTAVVAKVEGDVNEEYTNASASRPSSQEDLTVPQDPARLRQELSDARETIQRMQQQIERYSQSGSHGDGKVMTAVVPVNNAGYPATFGRAVFRASGPFAELWKEYAKADVRWGMADPTIVSLEILTVLGAGPLCVLLMYQIVQNDPARYYNYVVLSVAELYGGWMTFCPEWLTGSVFLNTDNWLHNLLYLWFFNGIWVAIPGYLLYHAYVEIVYPLRTLTPVMPVQKEEKKE